MKTNLWGESDGKVRWETSDEQTSIEHLCFQCFISKYGQFKLPYFGNIWIKNFFRETNLTPMRLESTPRSLARSYIHYTMESIHVKCRWFLYNTKQQEVTKVYAQNLILTQNVRWTFVKIEFHVICQIELPWVFFLDILTRGKKRIFCDF